ncbi:MAG TPA: hypothetical protein VN851_13865 [Thermoanaerobaculia bacterium]|nr:hypothetical protein [Thermoanaerobaculia bacterium]
MADRTVVKEAEQLAGFIARYSPEIAERAHDVLARMRARLPGAVELVFDNYNALAIGFGPTDRADDAIFSIALYPRWVSLFFLQAANLPDPQKLLAGSGSVARHIVLDEAEDLDRPEIRDLMETALVHAKRPLDPDQPYLLVIKSISAKQRPRRAAAP